MRSKVQLLQKGITFLIHQKMPFYAVARGRKTGIFSTWKECSVQVTGFQNPSFRKFTTRKEAQDFITRGGILTKADNYSITESENIPKEKSDQVPKEFWPDEVSDDGDDLLIAAAEEIGDSGTSSTKRKTNFDLSVSNKKLKHDSTVWEPIGLKKYGKFNFPIDSEGFVIVYTDGSCEDNGKATAVAGFGVYFSENHPLNTARPVSGRATNNCGEIQAAIYAIKIAKDVGIPKLCISTDSQFLINSVTSWLSMWKRKGWKLKSGGEIKNIDEFRELDELLSEKTVKVKWNYVKGHDGIIGNEKADRLARQGASMYRTLHNK